MRAKELCIREVAHITQEASALDAARLMRRRHVGDLVVVEQVSGAIRPIGLITDRDLVLDVLAPADVDPASTPISRLMTCELITARDDEEVSAVLERMRAFGVRRMPIVDGLGSLVGIITHDDVVAWLADEATLLAEIVRSGQAHERRRVPPVEPDPAQAAARPGVR